MHDPRARVVGSEANRNVVACIPDVDDVALNGVRKVVGAAPGATNDAECVAVQMDRMLGPRCECWASGRVEKGTYWPADGAARHRNLNDLISRKDVNAPSWEEILGGACSTQNLQ